MAQEGHFRSLARAFRAHSAHFGRENVVFGQRKTGSAEKVGLFWFQSFVSAVEPSTGSADERVVVFGLLFVADEGFYSLGNLLVGGFLFDVAFQAFYWVKFSLIFRF